MPSRAIRPSPTASATSYSVGHIEKGNDGRMWQVTANSAGTQRWVPTRVIPVITNQPLTYRFDVGDLVKVTTSGVGCAPEEVGLEATITELGIYGMYNGPGYKVDKPIGNCKQPYNDFKGFIGEQSFDIVQPKIIFTKKTKPVKLQTMARVKSITKRTTQEVRKIETSLINKEEVFKMLALAEATGLPCLLIGEPGVNSK